MKDKKVLNIENIKNKTVELLKKSIKGVELAEQAESEIRRAISSQSESNLELIIAESLVSDIVEQFNKKYKKD